MEPEEQLPETGRGDPQAVAGPGGPSTVKRDHRPGLKTLPGASPAVIAMDSVA